MRRTGLALFAGKLETGICNYLPEKRNCKGLHSREVIVTVYLCYAAMPRVYEGIVTREKYTGSKYTFHLLSLDSFSPSPFLESFVFVFPRRIEQGRCAGIYWSGEVKLGSFQSFNETED